MELTDEQFLVKFERYQDAIADSYKRMATNEDQGYRAEQLLFCSKQLAELQNLYENYTEQWIRLAF